MITLTFSLLATISAPKVDAVPVDVEDVRWATAPATTVSTATQHTLTLNDRDAKTPHDAPTLTVRALHDADELAVLVEWRDETRDSVSTDETNVFGDSIAMQIPLKFGAGLRLPYVGMGDEDAPVVLTLQRALENGSMGRSLVAAGFGSSTRARVSSLRLAMRYEDKTWRAVFVRPIDAPLIPVAFAVWDGAHHERGGNKSLSAWQLVKLEGRKLDEKYLAELTWQPKGDVAKGKVLVESMCVACHYIGDKRVAAPGMAPELTNIGMIASPSYLRQSVTAPSAIVVPYRAWWYRGADGKKVSKMPPFALPESDVDAIVSYLSTLGAAAKEGS